MKSVIDEVWEEGREEGKKEGVNENSKSTAIRLIKLDKISLEDIALVTGLPFEDIKKLKAQLL